MGGFPVKLIDTAGITETDDPVERIGITRTFRAVEEAHLVLVLLDGSQSFGGEDQAIWDAVPEGKEKMICLTKSDLPLKIQLPSNIKTRGFREPVSVSAFQKNGLEKLEESLLRFLESVGHLESSLVTNVRHAEALENALKALKRSEAGLKEKLSLELIAEDLKEALSVIGEVVGEVYTEDLLDVIFSQFCIGK
jgi:tRNA modification GTPase